MDEFVKEQLKLCNCAHVTDLFAGNYSIFGLLNEIILLTDLFILVDGILNGFVF